MKKTNKLFNIFLFVSLGLTIFATVFSILSLCLTYTETIANIKVTNVFSLIFITFTTLAVAIPIAQSIVIKDFKITRAKNNMVFLKVASVLLMVALLALALYDFIAFCKGLSSKPSTFATWKFFRIFITFPFVISLVLSLFPQARTPSFVRYCCALTPVAWALFSVLAIYFHQGPTPVPEFFRITFSIIYIFASLFFLYDFKWNNMESSTRIYVALVSIFTIFTFIISVSSIIFLVVDETNDTNTVINVIEILTSIALSLYGLSKLIAFKRAVAITAKNEK